MIWVDAHISPVVRLINAVAAQHVCVVRLPRPMGDGGKARQLGQNRALLRWVKPTAAPAPHGERRR